MSSVTYYPEYKKKEWIEYKDVPLDMLNARYGRIATDQKQARELKHKRYNQMEVWIEKADHIKEYEKRMKDAGDTFFTVLYDPKTVWNDWVPRFDSGITEREETLWDLIDTLTGYVLVRTFKGDCKRFLDTVLKDIVVYDMLDEYVELGLGGKKIKKSLCVYKIGCMTLRSWNKYELKEL